MAMQKAAMKKPKSVKAAKGVARAKPAQHRFLAELIDERRSVAIFLVNGLKLEGKIASFDDYAILLEGEMSDHVYKHAISTIQPLAGAPSKVDASAKKGVLRVMPEAGAGAKPRTPRQPTIVVRPKRRVIKTPVDES